MARKRKRDVLGEILDETLGGVVRAFGHGLSRKKQPRKQPGLGKSFDSGSRGREFRRTSSRRDFDDGPSHSSYGYTASPSARSRPPDQDRGRLYRLVIVSGIVLVAAGFWIHRRQTQNQVQPAHSTAPTVQYQAPPASAPEAQPKAPAPQPVAYQSKVTRRNAISYEVLLGTTEGWFDTNIPVIVDQQVDVYETDGSELRWAAQLGGEVRLPQRTFQWGGTWLVWFETTHITFNKPIEFFDTLKLKLSDVGPGCHLQVQVTQVQVMDTCAHWLNRRRPDCAEYDSIRDVSVAKYMQYQEQLPIDRVPEPLP